jgi:subfamily B ATP-binding cassette protein MsbA
MTNTIAQTAVGVERIRAILEADELIVQRPDAYEPKSLRGEIAFEHVEFGYEKDTPVLRDVNFVIGRGQMVGIVGPTGSGKSTIVSLIPRFYEAAKGTVKIDGVDIRNYTLDGLRQHIAFVLQDTVLFRGTIAENIAYGRPNATKEEIVEAAARANADEFIRKMPQGFETMVGDRGLTLSGGQRQRIGIARALIRDTPILILDEPTAALDSEAEGHVVEALERLMKGRTVIMIAHRLSTIRDANQIIVLKDGVVAESGTHDRLLSLSGVYAELYQKQFEPAPART